ncbi:MAG TPA: hypothetical protein DHU72_04625 [Rikenellaceae bacterium]|nr:hypothetical protein [Rikenellaceae bacterium]
MLNDAHVAPARKVFVPSAVAKAVLTDAEKENGVAMVEVGAGVSSVTIYKGKLLRHYSSIPFGGKNITSDIKYECGFTEDLAENIKMAFGACMPDKLQTLNDKIIQINDNENGSYEQLPVRYLSEIITSRADEIINAILYQIQESGYADSLRNGIFESGGCANMVNFANMLREMSGYTVRIGYPRSQVFSSGGCPGVTETSAAACIGMVLEVKQDIRLNCIEEAPSEAESTAAGTETGTVGETQAPSIEDHSGKLFEDQQTEVITPNKKKKEHTAKVTWKSLLGGKIAKGLEKTFDNTVGGLFDEMK